MIPVVIQSDGPARLQRTACVAAGQKSISRAAYKISLPLRIVVVTRRRPHRGDAKTIFEQASYESRKRQLDYTPPSAIRRDALVYYTVT